MLLPSSGWRRWTILLACGLIWYFAYRDLHASANYKPPPPLQPVHAPLQQHAHDAPPEDDTTPASRPRIVLAREAPAPEPEPARVVTPPPPLQVVPPPLPAKVVPRARPRAVDTAAPALTLAPAPSTKPVPASSTPALPTPAAPAPAPLPPPPAIDPYPPAPPRGAPTSTWSKLIAPQPPPDGQPLNVPYTPARAGELLRMMCCDGETMMSRYRQGATIWLASYVLAWNVPGHFLDVGVAGGGSSMILWHVLNDYDPTPARQLFMFDNWSGNAAPQHARDQSDDRLAAGKCIVVLNRFLFTIRRHGAWLRPDLEGNPHVPAHEGIPDRSKLRRAEVVGGWIQDTMNKDLSARIEKIAYLRIDVNSYASTTHALTFGYPLLSPGGVVWIDNFGLYEACKAAVMDYRHANGIRDRLYAVHDYEGNGEDGGDGNAHIEGVWWIKGTPEWSTKVFGGGSWNGAGADRFSFTFGDYKVDDKIVESLQRPLLCEKVPPYTCNFRR